MATTTNYGWTTPDDTALVKDGASAIRTLGTAIDTTTFNNASAAIAKTIVDAKGDIIAATAADTVSRLAVGANDTVLTADSAQATGLKWATPSSGGMTLISTTTLTGASVTLSSIPQTYNNLQLIIRSFKPANDAADIRIRVNGDSTANRHAAAGVDAGDDLSFNAALWAICRGQDNGSDNSLISLTVFDYTNAATWKIANCLAINNHQTTATNYSFRNAMYVYNQISAISSFTMFPETGNFTSGTVLLYGVK